MRSNVARSRTGELIVIQPRPVDIVHENGVVIFFWPCIAPQIYHSTGMGVAATGRRGPKITGMGATVSQIMHVVGNGLDIIIGIGIEMLPPLSLIPRPLNDMVHMGNNANGDKGMSIVVKIYSPRVTGTFGKDLELMSGRMVAPYRGIQLRTLFIGGTRFSDIGIREHAVYPIEPTIRAPP